jgi:mannitol/fructose-specific phosphotransferase system IIA component (Ntr-type)
MKLSEHLRSDAILVNYPSRTKSEVLDDLTDLVCCAHGLPDRELVHAAILAREAQVSTGVGCGLAVPHAKIPGIKDLCIAALVCREGLNFESQDNGLAHLAFLILSPENTIGPHMRALSSISRLMADSQVRAQLIQSSDSEEFMQLLREAEERYA